MILLQRLLKCSNLSRIKIHPLNVSISCLALLQDESEIHFQKYPSTSLPDLVTNFAVVDNSPSPTENKENVKPESGAASHSCHMHHGQETVSVD